MDYRRKTLKLKLRAGRSYTFTATPDALLAFQQKVEAARKRL